MRKILVAVLLMFVSGCSEKTQEVNVLSEQAEIAKSYLENEGYEVASFEKEGQVSYTKEELAKLQYQQIWGVQSVEPDSYLDKELASVQYLVKNHLFSNMYESDKAEVTVLLDGGKVIGGWSLPYTKEVIVGSVYSIDGKSAEDVKENYQQWLNDWRETYGSD